MPYKPFTKRCNYCKKDYFTKHPKSKYCSFRCFGAFWQGKPSRGKPFKKNHFVSEKTRKAVREAQLGSKHSEEHKRKIGEKLKGKPKSEEAVRKISNENNYLWKGKNVSYTGLHQWVARKLGKPSKCKYCGTTNAKKFEWANISRKYFRNLEDWIRLCTSCHRKYDYKRTD